MELCNLEAIAATALPEDHNSGYLRGFTVLDAGHFGSVCVYVGDEWICTSVDNLEVTRCRNLALARPGDNDPDQMNQIAIDTDLGPGAEYWVVDADDIPLLRKWYGEELTYAIVQPF